MSDTHLRLRVGNLGPIEHGHLDLRPLTVLIGKNNTGKTYLSQAVYAAYKAVEENRIPSLLEPLTPDDVLSLRDTTRDQFTETSLTMPATLVGPASHLIENGLKSCSVFLKDRLRAYFGVPELMEITKWDSYSTELLVDLHHVSAGQKPRLLFGIDLSGHASQSILQNITLTSPDNTLELAPLIGLIEGMTRGNPTLPLSHLDRLPLDDLLHSIRYTLSESIWNSFLTQIRLSGQAHYLPAGRSGLLSAWTDVIRLQLQLARDRFGLTGRTETSIGGVALDFLSALSEILDHRNRSFAPIRRRARSLTKRKAPKTSPALALLEELMEGHILAGSVDDSVPTLEYQQQDHRIPVQRASSMVADLAPLAMWVKHLVRPGDLLIIDEPESHLHPSAIRLVARALVRLVNQKVQVVCATHSSVLLHELSNCLLRSQLPQELFSDTNSFYSSSERLALEDIAVHRFLRAKPDAPVEIEQVEIQEDWGIPEDEYVDVSTNLSNESAWLIGQLS